MTYKALFVGLLLAGSTCGWSQFGLHVNAGSHLNSGSPQNGILKPEAGYHLGGGPSWWFRLKSRRLEFNPAAILDFESAKYNSSSTDQQRLLGLSYGLALPVMIYPFDFGNDCNCPTFNKQGEFFKKGLYLMVYTAAFSTQRTLKVNQEESQSSEWQVQLGLGAGLDFGLSRKWTISPAFMLSRIVSGPFELSVTGYSLSEENISPYRAELVVRALWYSRKKRY